MSKKLIPSEKIELIIFKLFSTKPKYINLLLEYVEKSWFENRKVGELVNIVKQFYVKFHKLPNDKTVELLISKYFQEEESRKECETIFEKSKALNVDEFDEEFIDDNVVEYLKSSAYYSTIMKNIDEIQSTHNCASCCTELSKISSMTLEYNIGLSYIDDIEGILDRLGTPHSRLPTGLTSVDETMCGGLLAAGKCLCIIQAATHVGKSLVLTNIAANMLKQDKFVVIFTLEMSEDVYAQRISANLVRCNVNLVGMQTESDLIKNKINLIKEKYPNSKLLIKEFPPDSITCNNIKSHLDKVVMMYNRKPDIIIVDYLTLLLPNNKKADSIMFEKYKDVAEELRALTYYFSCPLVTAAQSNRSGMDNSVSSLAQIGSSVGIPQTADYTLGLAQQPGDKEVGIIRGTVLKNRLGGQIGKEIQLQIDYNSLCLTDIETVDNVENTVLEGVKLGKTK